MQCLYCQKEFKSERLTAKYCSDYCRKSYFRKSKVSVANPNIISVAKVSVASFPKSDNDWYDVRGKYHNHQEWMQIILPRLKAQGASENQILTKASI